MIKKLFFFNLYFVSLTISLGLSIQASQDPCDDRANYLQQVNYIFFFFKLFIFLKLSIFFLIIISSLLKQLHITGVVKQTPLQISTQQE